MSAVYARKSILARIDRTITDSSSKDSDGKFLQEACIISDYNSAEFTYIGSIYIKVREVPQKCISY